MHPLIIISILSAVVQATYNSRDLSQDHLTGRIFSRSPGNKRRISENSPASCGNGNKRQRQASNPSPQAAGPSRPSPQQHRQSPVSLLKDNHQRASKSPDPRDDRGQRGLHHARSRSPSPSEVGSNSPSNNSQRQQARSEASDTDPTSSYPTSSSPNQSSDRHGPRTSSETMGGSSRRASSASHSDRSHSTDSHSSLDSPSSSSSWGSSSAASTPRRANPVFAAMLTTGPATVSLWKGRTRSEMKDPVYIPEGRQKLIDGSNGKSVVISAVHHGPEASTYVTGTGRKVGVDARYQNVENPIATTIRIPNSGVNPLHGDRLRHITPTHPGFYGSQLEALVTGHGRVDMEARNPGPQSSSDLDF